MLITADVAAAEAAELRQSRSWLRGLLVPKVIFGLAIVVFFILLAVFGPWLDHTSPDTTSAVTLRPPSLSHWLGTTQQGQDVLAQVIYGARISMEVGLGAGVLTTLWSVLVGLTGGYIAGVGSELLSMFSNVFLVIPSLPLVVILAAYLPNSGSFGIILVITATGWAWGARVLRAQTLSLRRRDFVEAARATGESSVKIMLYDILPNELAIITATFLASVVGAILTEASIAFLGLSNVTQWSWGTILYWAQVSGAELARAWWWFVPPGLCIALIGTGLAFVNFGIDDVINPRLRSAGQSAAGRRRGLRGTLGSVAALAARLAGRGRADDGGLAVLDALQGPADTADFARAFVPLLGNAHAIGESVNVTSGDILTWDQIHHALAAAAGVAQPVLAHRASETIALAWPAWAEVLEHDFRHSMLFDTAKLSRLVPGFRPQTTFSAGARAIIQYHDSDVGRRRVDPELDAAFDRLLA